MAKLNVDTIEDAPAREDNSDHTSVPNRCDACGGLLKPVRMHGDFALCRCFRVKKKRFRL